MNNREAVIAVLVSHREARAWTDEAVADDLLKQLDLKPTGEAKKAIPAVDPSLVTEAEVVAHEAAAKEAIEKARVARATLNAQAETEDKARLDAAADQAKSAQAARDAAMRSLPTAPPPARPVAPPVAQPAPQPVAPAPRAPTPPVPPQA
jgi:hypothetical protein